MAKIKLLPDRLVNQIAAGEVVERPLSIVKELVENSIDAGATEIAVELKKGGKSSIIIRDNGCGMSEEDIYMSLERHATSKIDESSDLFAIETKGFRGEAIPSIASVSHFSVLSALSHGDGHRVVMKGGNFVESEPHSMARGTEIRVERLFFNMPVRKRFLKSDEAEYALIREFLQKCSVLYDKIGFTFISNSRKVFSFSSREDRELRLMRIWNAEKDDLRRVEKVIDDAMVTVVAGSPLKSFSGGSMVSVNGRIVSDRKINAVLYRVSRELVGGSFRATVFIDIELPFDRVDVNVHPSKLEIRFLDERAVLKGVEETIREAILSFRKSGGDEDFSDFLNGPYISKSQALQAPSASYEKPSQESLFSWNREENRSDFNSTGTRSGNYSAGKIGDSSSFEYGKRGDSGYFSVGRNDGLGTGNSFKSDFSESSSFRRPGNFNSEEKVQGEDQVRSGETSIFTTCFKNYRVVGRVFDLYIVVEMDDDVYFIDQHASHERITFKRLLSAMKQKSGLSQLSVAPEMVRLSPKELLVFKEHRSLLEEIGFVVEPFDEDSIVLRGVPALALVEDWSRLLKDMLNEIAEHGYASAWDEKFLHFVATRACHSSVRHSDKLSEEEITSLIEDINNSETLTCPHGRPFFHRLSRDEIEKKVKR